MSKRPIIAITRPVQRWDATKLFFTWMVWVAGGKPIFVTQDNYRQIESIDGLILSGGSDINPSRYGEKPNTYIQYDEARDAFEFDILNQVIKQNKPVLGVCRGMQLLNVYKGGTLFTDIKKVYDIGYTPQSFFTKCFYRKTVFLSENTFLNIKEKIRKARVNSIHHQSINQLGASLSKAAYDRYGIVQAVEDSASKIYGVQWHPEYLFYKVSQINIFRNFVRTALSDEYS